MLQRALRIMEAHYGEDHYQVATHKMLSSAPVGLRW